jgi:ABC-2 type transport system permease protein
LLVTAVTAQFQGWMELLMRSPRRRRAMVAMLTAAVVIGVQAPALLNLAGLRSQVAGARGDPRRLEEAVLWGNALLPVGWLPLGIKAAVDRDPGRLCLAAAGMAVIGIASLRRAYRTTIALCQGQATAHGGAGSLVPAAAGGRGRPSLLERRIPGVPDAAAAVALAGLRSLVRAPEVKMMLVAPVALCVLSVAWATRVGSRTVEADRLLLGVMAIVVSLFGVGGLVGNQFGYDRDGFRTFVLSALSRRDILLGKNLAAAPLPLGEFVILLTVVQVCAPLRWDHLLGLLPQALVMYLLTCLLLNMLSILVPLRVDPRGVRPGLPVLSMIANMTVILILFPLVQLLALGPLWIEALARWCGWLPGVPLFLPLALLQSGLVAPVYIRCLELEGRLLQDREQRILDVVTGRAS